MKRRGGFKGWSQGRAGPQQLMRGAEAAEAAGAPGPFLSRQQRTPCGRGAAGVRIPGLPWAPGEDTCVLTLCGQQFTCANGMCPFRVEAAKSEAPALCSPSAWKDRPRRQDSVGHTPGPPRGGEASIGGMSHPSERLSQERRAVGGENLEVGFLVPLESWREFIQGGRECMKRLWVSQAERVPAEGSWVRRFGVRPGSGVGARPELGVGACSASHQGDARGRMPGVALWPCEVPGRGQEGPAGPARAVCCAIGRGRGGGTWGTFLAPRSTPTPRGRRLGHSHT